MGGVWPNKIVPIPSAKLTKNPDLNVPVIIV